MAKKGLGRGLGVIFGTQTEEGTRIAQDSSHAAGRAAVGADGGSPADNVSRETFSLETGLIEPNAAQPRKRFDEESLRELADSIAQHGVLQPILVKKKGDKYEIIVGERRWRAARLAGLKEIPAVIREMDGREAAEAALIENLQREDLGSVEEARAYRTLIDEYSMTQEELAAALSRSRAAIANSLRLLKLDPEILELVESGELTAGHARAVLSISGKGNRQKAVREILSKDLSVRQAEKLAKRYAKAGEKTPAVEAAGAVKEEILKYIRAAEKELTAAMNTKVSIKPSNTGRGKIEIEYYSDDELNAIIEKLTGSN